ncbi:MAG: c-type cytochrome biogenesis protein CcmI [Pseudomonadales bacterium]|nr:c-type cytochrome biogenesis protein CcmI [Pseudomonadales bacterium]MCP5213946.1 c-type cytochrome biogenesis protein CcmI [Pseudomonadales bacterium]MCP5302844.1 c-type cytochrome biogenesis protein CcmI [Pseudomonadales bacterium]
MTLFWWLAAMLTIVALGFIWFPILRNQQLRKRAALSPQAINIQAYHSRIAELDSDRQEERIDEAEYQSLKAELERNLLADTQGDQQSFTKSVGGISASVKVLVAVLSLTLVLVSISLYWSLGSSQVLVEMEAHQAASDRLARLPATERLQALKEMAEKSPERAEIWYALAQGYIQTQRYSEAEDAYNRVLMLVGEDPQVLAEYAQSLFFVENNHLGARGKELAERALAVDPGNDTALGLLGIDAFDREQYADAIRYWRQILAGSPHERDAKALQAGIARAEQLLALQTGSKVGLESAEVVERSPSDIKTVAELEVEVVLSEDLQSKTSPQQTVFIFARALNGPPMPLAAVRLQVQDLPAKVVLNDSMAMTPQAKLSGFDQVEVIARVAFSQTATASAGDLQGKVSPINLSESPTNIKLVIDNVVE